MTRSAIAVIEGLLRDEPYDWMSWMVYADYLCDVGDPRGALINSVGSAESRELEQRLIAEASVTLGSVRAHDWENAFLISASLTIHDEDDLADLERVLEAPYARLLRELVLEVGAELDADTLARLGSLSLARLRVLSIAEQPGDALLGALVGAATQLVELDCRGCGLTLAGARALAELASAGTLRRLHLQRNAIPDAGLAVLAPKLVGLELLDLRDNDIGHAGLAALAGTPALAALRTLRLQLDTFKLDELEVLAKSTSLPLPIRRYVGAVFEQRRSDR